MTKATKNRKTPAYYVIELTKQDEAKYFKSLVEATLESKSRDRNAFHFARSSGKGNSRYVVPADVVPRLERKDVRFKIVGRQKDNAAIMHMGPLRLLVRN
ncbi:MAG: hypothetical protein KGH49_03690 [Candidatus Micrarchaeota archaeon]|nr:hypothetical protein [Candidatus Micrarchaeota archaeon]